MSRSTTDVAPASDPSSPCPSIVVLEAMAIGGAAAATDEVAAHLSGCSRCQGTLEEMRSANAFLARFGSGAAHVAPETPDHPSAPLIRVHGYEIEGLLGFGGQGAVYKARQKATGRDVAIKVPLGDTQRRPSTRFRFQREIELTARLDHPGIVRVLGDCELADGRIGCVMEFIEGEPIDRWAAGTRGEGRAGVRRIVGAIAEVADAIAFAHQRAVMHRDLKPSNVVVMKGGTTRVLDFGLAKAIDDTGRSFCTNTGAFVGTLIYAAPEQISGDPEAADLRTDVYGLGLLLFQALTGRLPYPADAPTLTILECIRSLPPPRPSSLAPDIGGELDAIVLKALAKEKDRRYASARELCDDLRAWLDGRAVRARFDSRWYQARKAVRRHRWTAATAAVSLTALTTMGLLGLVAREQTLRAGLADAVRDARVLESHWVRLAEARATALDNFEVGETIAWDALLNPEQILLDEAVEGFDAGRPTPVSPAYWALWEIYQRTPVLQTLPHPGPVVVLFPPGTDTLVAGWVGTKQIQWLDWRRGEVLRSIEAPLAGSLRGMVAISSTRALAFDATGPAMLLDAANQTAYPVGDRGIALNGVATNERAAATVLSPDGAYECQLWNIADIPPSIVHRISLSDTGGSNVFDSSGRYLMITTGEGAVVALDAGSGEVLLHRTREDEPRFIKATTRGNIGEFILFGPEMIASVNMAGDPLQDIEQAPRKRGFIDGVRNLSNAASADLYAGISDRGRLGLSRKSAPPTEGRFLPALSVSLVSLSADGRHAAIIPRPSMRGAILHLDSPGVRRLPFNAEITADGFATIFSLEFSDDSQSLLVGAMDGTIRRFDTESGAQIEMGIDPIPGGVTALRSIGEHVYAGTHDLGLKNAKLVRIGKDGTETIIPGNERWFCGLESSPGWAVWALTGEGHLLMIDPETATVIRETRIHLHHTSHLPRALARLPRHRLLLVGPAGAGIEIIHEDSLQSAGPSVAMRPIREIVVNPADPDMVATGADDGIIRIWRARAGPPPTLEPVRTFGVHAGPVYCLAFSPDGRLLASGGGAAETRDVRLWDVERGRELAALDLFELGAFDIKFSPDGRWLAVGGEPRIEHPEEGGQLYLIDLHAPNQCIAGNLEYQLARFLTGQGREAPQGAAIRRWAAGVRASMEPAAAP